MNIIKNQARHLLTLGILYACLSTLSFAQTPAETPFEPTFTEWEFMKVLPGKEADYLKVEKVWKKVHQRRKAEGKILAWTLLRRVYPNGTNTAYDYAAITTYKSGVELEATSTLTLEYVLKGLSKEEVAIVNNTANTRNKVGNRLSMLLERIQPLTKYLRITSMRINPGKGEDLEKMEKMMNPVFQEANKAGSLACYRFARKLYPRDEMGGTYFRIYGTNTMDQMIKNETNGFVATAYKKVYPTKDFKDVQKGILDLMTVVDTEVWETVDATQ